MKKLILLFTLICSLNVFGQSYKDSEVVFYGIDFSQAKVYGASELYGHFREAFHAINMLFISEPNKYDVGKILHIDISSIDLEAVQEESNWIDPEDFHTVNRKYELTDEQIQDAINSLPLREENGTGLVILAQLLNKADKWGSYMVVYFDIDTREILDAFETGGKPGGYGLRNFWARSMLEGLKKVK